MVTSRNRGYRQNGSFQNGSSQTAHPQTEIRRRLGTIAIANTIRKSPTSEKKQGIEV